MPLDACWQARGRDEDRRADEQEFGTEDQHRSKAVTGTVVHTRPFSLDVWCLNIASRVRSLVPSERVGNSWFPLIARLLRKPGPPILLVGTTSASPAAVKEPTGCLTIVSTRRPEIG